jgi:hypothetical protein
MQRCLFARRVEDEPINLAWSVQCGSNDLQAMPLSMKQVIREPR